jgi:N-acetylglutamate synthase-like GNAT family acetyltransferase
MASAVGQSNAESAAIVIQRRYRQYRHLTRAKKAAYKTPLYVCDLKQRFFRNVAAIVRTWISTWKESEKRMDTLDDIRMNACDYLRNPDKNARAIGAFDAKQNLQGILIYRPAKKKSEICRVTFIACTDQKNLKGVGTALMERMVHIATQVKSRSPYLFDLQSTKYSEGFYKKLGLASAGNMFFLEKSDRDEFLNAFAGRAMILEAAPEKDTENPVGIQGSLNKR